MKRFVILEHSTKAVNPSRPAHWDLMFETAGELLTWAVANYPWVPRAVVSATQLAPHRLAYLEFEGALSGNRGIVQRCEQGAYQLIEHDSHTWRARVDGETLRGIIQLSRQPATSDWNLVWIEDQDWE